VNVGDKRGGLNNGWSSTSRLAWPCRTSRILQGMLSRRKRRVKSLVRANEPRCASCTVADGAVPADSSRGSDPVYLGRAVSIWGLNNAGGGITGIKRSVSFLLDFHLWCCFPYSLLRCRCWTDWASVKAVLALRVLQNDRCNEVFS